MKKILVSLAVILCSYFAVSGIVSYNNKSYAHNMYYRYKLGNDKEKFIEMYLNASDSQLSENDKITGLHRSVKTDSLLVLAAFVK